MAEKWRSIDEQALEGHGHEDIVCVTYATPCHPTFPLGAYSPCLPNQLLLSPSLIKSICSNRSPALAMAANLQDMTGRTQLRYTTVTRGPRTIFLIRGGALCQEIGDKVYPNQSGTTIEVSGQPRTY